LQLFLFFLKKLERLITFSVKFFLIALSAARRWGPRKPRRAGGGGGGRRARVRSGQVQEPKNILTSA
jgi:hypothetical protein